MKRQELELSCLLGLEQIFVCEAIVNACLNPNNPKNTQITYNKKLINIQYLNKLFPPN